MDGKSIVEEVSRQLSMQVSNTIDEFVIREVQEYADKYNDTITINAKKIYEAIKKQTPMKVKIDMMYPYCPYCSLLLNSKLLGNYCMYCGQKLDWKKGE